MFMGWILTFHHIQKLNQNLNARINNIKLLEEIKRRGFMTLDWAMISLIWYQKHGQQKKYLISWTPSKLKLLCTKGYSQTEGKGNVKNGKYLQIIYLTKDWYPDYTKTSTVQHQQKAKLNRHSLKLHRWPRSTWKDAQHHSH